VLVRKAGNKKGVIPRWLGGRMPLSSQMSELIRQKVSQASKGNFKEKELLKLEPLLNIQKKWSIIPRFNELLIEKLQSREGFHLFFYPFEGRYVHEVLASVIAYRISQIESISFSIAMNDYGFELLADKPIPIEESIEKGLFNTGNLLVDIHHSINEAEMAKRKFRDIATIAGLVFRGFPGSSVKYKHLQANSQLFFDVFQEYDPENLLVKQSFEEVLNLQLEQSRFMEAMKRINEQEIKIVDVPRPTPFAFPIFVDRMREKLSSEKLEDRILKMQLQLEKAAAV
jgi:ATP-dependent Lhr-like helicase